MAEKLPGIAVPMVLSLFRFKMPDGSFTMAADLPADQLQLDVPGSIGKLVSFKLDPTLWYVTQTKVMHDGGMLVTKTQAPFTGQIDASSNMPRNVFSGEFDEFDVYLIPTPATPTASPTP